MSAIDQMDRGGIGIKGERKTMAGKDEDRKSLTREGGE